ncbi:MAG: Unknown protein [uncultured Sulfurovum sp.]|uniref:LHH domain-containing protein n=1 Tax=uncultured Sulfurovum sp. TaxID=269237 RepID=A0A6S6U983_9BACT|nr:MAG: Unknown protein [uncultured Sulfurovum sp.]
MSNSTMVTQIFKEGIKELIFSEKDNSLTASDKELSNYVDLMENRVNEDSEYSTEVNEYIKNSNELNVYQNANLIEENINNRIILKSSELDPTLQDEKNRTNIERMEQGLAPIDEYGESYHLHHIGQKMDSPLAELQGGEHKIYYSTLHDTYQKESLIDRNVFNKERTDHWKSRAEELKNI